jgi:chromosome segregation ATPase
MSDRPTPRTDAFFPPEADDNLGYGNLEHYRNFSRELERELDEAREWSSKLADLADDLRAELAEARAAMARELDRVAPTPGDKFALMVSIDPMLERALRAERELADAIRERDNAESDRKQAEADTLRALHERNEARETIAEMETRHAAVMLHTQGVVDEANATREQRDQLADALKNCMTIIGPPGNPDGWRWASHVE